MFLATVLVNIQFQLNKYYNFLTSFFFFVIIDSVFILLLSLI